MKNFTKKLTLLAVALSVASSILPSGRAVLAFKGFLRPIAKAKPVFNFGVSRFGAQAAKPIASHAFTFPVLNTVTVSPAYDTTVISQIAQFAAKAAARNEASKALVPGVSKVASLDLSLASLALRATSTKAQDTVVPVVASAASNALAFIPVTAASNAFAPVVSRAAQGIVTPLVVVGGCSPRFDLVPAQTAKNTYSAVSELLTRCKQNATGKNVAIASATIAAIACTAYFAYYMWSKPATLVTAAVGTPVVKITVPVVESTQSTLVAPEGAILDESVVSTNEVVAQVEQAETSIGQVAAQSNSYYSYVSGLFGAAWTKAKSLVVPAVQKTITQANESKDNAAAAVVVGAITRKLQRLDAEIKAQAVEEDEKAAKEVVATPLVEAA